MFEICVISNSNELIESLMYRRCRVTFGDFSEEFLAPLGYWDATAYQDHWRGQLHELIERKLTQTFLIGEMYDPITANFLKWWPIYRGDNCLYIQEHILFFEDLEDRFILEKARRLLPPRETHDEDGEQISEWVVSENEIAIFLSSIDG